MKSGAIGDSLSTIWHGLNGIIGSLQALLQRPENPDSQTVVRFFAPITLPLAAVRNFGHAIENGLKLITLKKKGPPQIQIDDSINTQALGTGFQVLAAPYSGLHGKLISAQQDLAALHVKHHELEVSHAIRGVLYHGAKAVVYSVVFYKWLKDDNPNRHLLEIIAANASVAETGVDVAKRTIEISKNR